MATAGSPEGVLGPVGAQRSDAVASVGAVSPLPPTPQRATWGARPATTDIGFNMVPIQARAAVAGVHKLAGWAKLDPGDQTILDNLLGGETNELSAASRKGPCAA